MGNKKNKKLKRLYEQVKLIRKPPKREEPLVPYSMLISLRDHLNLVIPENGCDHTYKLTTEWLKTNNLLSQDILSWFQDNGGFCDCEILRCVKHSVKKML